MNGRCFLVFFAFLICQTGFAGSVSDAESEHSALVSEIKANLAKAVSDKVQVGKQNSLETDFSRYFARSEKERRSAPNEITESDIHINMDLKSASDRDLLVYWYSIPTLVASQGGSSAEEDVWQLKAFKELRKRKLASIPKRTMDQIIESDGSVTEILLRYLWLLELEENSKRSWIHFLTPKLNSKTRRELEEVKQTLLLGQMVQFQGMVAAAAGLVLPVFTRSMDRSCNIQ